MSSCYFLTFSLLILHSREVLRSGEVEVKALEEVEHKENEIHKQIDSERKKQLEEVQNLAHDKHILEEELAYKQEQKCLAEKYVSFFFYIVLSRGSSFI